ncbi:MAG: DNA methylase [Selenomonadaceae bacterium]|nr:DNA methylase [Selenomonadaceae bacterium]
MKTYISIDLKSFYASVECVERHFDPLSTNLVVADPSRTEKTICLAVSPSLKAHGIPGRARLFEVVQRVKEVNAERLSRAAALGIIRKGEDKKYHFTSSSFDAPTLDADPSLELSYYVAPPRMHLYEEYSTKIYSIYLKYVAPEDVHVYSIDEVFIDVTSYLPTYKMTAHELAMTMIREVLYTTGITATAGIGTNLYLAKVAMDIVAKHVPADKDGVRIAELDEMSYRRLLWSHRPLTDFWRVGAGICRRLYALGIYTMGDIARVSLAKHPAYPNEDSLYKAFGINAELLIDHAWGWEPVTIKEIKEYRPETNSLSSGQVLAHPYDYEKGRIIVREMTELLCLDLVKKRLCTDQLVLHISYDRESLTEVQKNGRTVYLVASTGKPYGGEVTADYYGRPHPSHAHGTGNLLRLTNSTKRIMEVVMELYTRIIDPELLIRRVNIAACGLIPEDEIPADVPEQLSLFVDYDELERKREQEKKEDEKERKIQQAMLSLHEKFGKNAVLKGTNLQEGATTIERNGQVGGHKA